MFVVDTDVTLCAEDEGSVVLPPRETLAFVGEEGRAERLRRAWFWADAQGWWA